MVIEDKIIYFGLILYAFSAAISMSGTQIGLGICLIAFIIKMIRLRNIEFEKTGLEYPILALLIMIFISVVFSLNFKASLKYYINRIVEMVIIYYLVFYNIKSFRFIKKLVFFFGFSLLVSSCYSIYQSYFLGISRASGFLHTLTYGSVILLLLPLIVLTYFYREEIFKKIFAIGISIVGGLSLVFTYTRGAWFGMVGGSIFFSIIKKNKFIVYVIIIFILLMVLIPSFNQRVQSIFDLHDSSNQERLLMWQSAYNMFKDFPLTGIGPGMFQKMYPEKYILPEAKVKKRYYAHNNYIHFLAETGILGLGSLVYLIFTVFYSNIKIVYKKNDYRWGIITGILVGIFAFLIHGLTFTNLADSETLTLFWVLLGIMMRTKKMNGDWA